MARTASDTLYQLIHSLDRTEKGYVKKFFAQHVIGDENDYVLLFEAIDALEEPNEQVLRESLAGSRMLSRLPAVKNYLYQRILEAMRVYHASKSPEREIVELLLDADFLWEKTHYEQAMVRIRKAKELARRYDEFAFWIKTISWEKNYRGVIRESPRFESTTDPLSAEQQHVLSLLQSTLQYEQIGNLLQHHLMLRAAGNRSGDEWLRSMPSHELFLNPAMALSRPAKINYHLILSNWHAFAGGDANTAANHAKEILGILEIEPDLTHARPDLELSMLQTYLQRCVDARRFDDYRAMAPRLWNPTGGKPSKNIDVKRFYRAMSTELGYAIVSGDNQRVLEKIAFMKERYTALRAEIPAQSRLSGTFLAARILIEQNRMREGGWWLREALSEEPNTRLDLHVAARLLQLRMAETQKDRALIGSLVRSLARFIKKYSLQAARLDAIVSYYRRIAELRTDRELQRIRKETAHKLRAFAQTGMFDPVASAGFDVLFAAHMPPASMQVESPLNY